MSFENMGTPEEEREARIINELRDVQPEKLMDMMQGANTEAARVNAEDPEKIKEYIQWVREWEDLINAIEDPIESEHQQIQRELARANIFQSSKMNELAREALMDAYTIATNNGWEDQADEIQEKIDSI